MADQRLDQVMLDVKQASVITSQAESNLKEQVKDAEALREILSGVDEEQRKILTSQLDIGESMSESRKTIESMKESLNRIPSISKAIDVIQKRTGKSYKESLDTLQKSLEATKKHTKVNKELLSAVNAIQQSYKQTSDQIERGSRSLKNLGKTEQELSRKRKKSMQEMQKLISGITSQVTMVFGGAGASGVQGLMKGGIGVGSALLGYGTGKAATRIGERIEERRKRAKEFAETGEGRAPSERVTNVMEKMQSYLPNITKVVTAAGNIAAEAAWYKFGIDLQKTRVGTQTAAYGRRLDIADTLETMTREEQEKYGMHTIKRGYRTGGVSALEEMKEFAANSKRYGDEITANITENMVIASGKVDKSWEHINILASKFKNTAEETGIPMEDLMKATAETAVQARFLNIDAKTVAQTYDVLAKNMQTLSKAGITRDMIKGMGARMLGTMQKAPLPLRAYWASRLDMPGSLEEKVQRMSLGGRRLEKNAAGTGYNITGEADPQIYIKVLEKLRETLTPLGLTGALTAAPVVAPGFTDKDVVALLLGDFEKLKDKIEDGTFTEETSSQNLLNSVKKIEAVQQAYQTKMVGLLTSIFTEGKSINESFTEYTSYSKQILNEIFSSKKGVNAKKHTGGLIPRGTVSEVLTNESMQHLGKDSFFAFNPTHDIKIGSPQTTKESLRRSFSSVGSGSEQKIEVNLNVNGSVITDNELLSKIESLFANRRGVV